MLILQVCIDSHTYILCIDQFSSLTQWCPTLCDPADCMQHARLSAPSKLLALAQIHVYRVRDAIQTSHLQSSPFLPAFNLSQDQVLFQRVSSSDHLAKVLELQLQHQSFNEYSGLISFRMDWLDLLAVQGTLKSLLQHHSSKESILQHSALFTVQISHPYITTGKTMTLTRWAR